MDISRIEAFFRADIGRRLLSAGSVKREIPFTLGLNSSEIAGWTETKPESPAGDKEIIMLQGVIDCCFEEDGELVLLDYKTDFVEEGASEAVAGRYVLQLDYYARALETITGKRVKSKYIYLIHSNETIEIFSN
jgi:ATP-dependent helicase/nuclease subunit A